jgi:hypothetical protein
MKKINYKPNENETKQTIARSQDALFFAISF